MKKLLFLCACLLSFIVPSIRVNALDNIDYEELFENHQSIMLIIHPDTGVIHYANQAAVDFYGYTRDVLIGMSINDINTLSDEEIADERQRAVLEERNFFIFKHRIASGALKIVHVYSYPTIIDNETYLFSIIIDQTVYAASEARNQIILIIFVSALIIASVIIFFLFINMKKKKQLLEQSMKTIEEQERTASTLIMNLPGIAYRCLDDEAWTMLYISDKIYDITGYTPANFYLENMKYSDLIVYEDRYLVRDMFKKGFEQRTSIEIEYRIKTKSGHVRWVKEVAQYINQKDASGYEIIEGFIQDVNAEKEADLHALYYKDLLQYIISSSNQGIAVHDKNMNYVYVSERYLDMYRIKEKDIIGKNHYEVFPDIPDKWKEVHQRVLKGETLSNDRDEFVRVDGSTDYTRWLSRPWYDEHGDIGGIIIYTEVINDLIEAELSAKETRDQLLLVMDNLPIGIAVNSVLPEVNFEYMNDYFPLIYGSTKEALSRPGSFFEEVYENEDFREYIKTMVLEGSASGDPKKMKWENVPLTKDGKIVKYIFAQNVRIPNSHLVISMVVDVTDQKRKEAEIMYTSNHDYLTDLPNRRYFEEMLQKLDQSAYYPLSISMIDVDGLKIINDAFGHEKGNDILTNVASFLLKHKRQQDFVARIGGDEFIILRPQTTLSESEVFKLSMMGESQLMVIDDLKISLSIGYAIKESSDMDIQDVLKEAEDNMYRNKILHGQSARNESVVTILNTLKDKYEEERIHSDKVSHYCMLMGRALNLTSDEVKELELAGLMHDIGKITIPDHILDKPGKLTEDEWKIMKNHTINGYNILRSADKYSRLAEYALTHHERYDGKGYPNGLSGDHIPLFSRIISVCDSYEAMTSDRPYRKALDKDIAIAELRRCSGTQFDPQLVDLFIDYICN